MSGDNFLQNKEWQSLGTKRYAGKGSGVRLSHSAGMTLRNICYQSVRSFEGRDIRVSQSYQVLVGKGLGAVAIAYFVSEYA